MLAVYGRIYWALEERFRFYKYYACIHGKLLPSCLTLCNPMDHSPPVSSVHGVSQARVLEWMVMPSLGDPPDHSYVSWLAGIIFTTSATWETLINITGHSNRAPNLQSFSQLPDLWSISGLSMWNGSWVTLFVFCRCLSIMKAIVFWPLLFWNRNCLTSRLLGGNAITLYHHLYQCAWDWPRVQ